MKKFTLLSIFIIWATYLFSQPSLQWEQSYNGPIYASDRITDSDFNQLTGDTYVTGVSDSTLGYNYVTIKYSATGQVIWRKRFAGPQFQDMPNAIKYDPVNNAVYVTGKSKGSTSNFDWLTIRYNGTTGDIVWTQRYNGDYNGNDEAIDLDVDAKGNIYVLGNVLEEHSNCLNTKVIKYSPSGAKSWNQAISDLTYPYVDILAYKLAVNENKVIVIYNEIEGINHYAYVVGLFTSDGSHTARFYPYSRFFSNNWPESGSYPIAFDGLGNVYIGSSSGQVLRLKTDVNTIDWVYNFFEEKEQGWLSSILVDQSNKNVYATGYVKNSKGDNDIIIGKCNYLESHSLWSKRYNGAGNGFDHGLFIAKDNLTKPNIYVSGYTTQADGNKQITTLKYDDNGNEVWSTNYKCGTNDVVPIGFFRDATDNLYITGYNDCNSSNEDYLTLKYCASAPPQPGVITGDTIICSGTSQTYSIKPVTGAISYSWILPNGWSGTSTTASLTTIAGTTSGNISVVANGSICSSQPRNLAVIVNTIPATPGAIDGNTTVCTNTSQTYSISPITGATSYVWTLPVGATGTSTSNNITVSYGSTAVSGNISVKGQNGCGVGLNSNLAITVNSLPANAGQISGITTVCQGQKAVEYNVSDIPNATTYIWTLPTGATGTSNAKNITVNYGNKAASGNLTVKAHNSCGDGAASSLPISVNPLPANAGTISGPSSVCSGQNSVNYTVPIIADATSYIWTLPSGATGTSTTNSITVNFGMYAISGNITVKGNNSCGDGIASTLAITVNHLPASAVTISGTTTVCQGQNSVTYTVPEIANATSYIWTLPTGATGYSTTNNIVVNYSTLAVSGNITVKGHNDCFDGEASSISIKVNPLPDSAGIISGATNLCKGQNSVSYSIPPISNATSYKWTLPAGVIGTSSTNSITVNIGTDAISGIISVKGHSDCGDGVESSLSVYVNTKPSVAGTITGNTSVCQGSSNITYTVPEITNATSYLWTLPKGATGTSTTNNITVSYENNAVSGNISVKGVNDCDEGLTSNLYVTIIPKPIANAGEDQSICAGSSVILKATGGSSYSWNNGISQGETFTPNTTTDYIVTVSNGLCNNSDTVTVLVNPLPPTPLIFQADNVLSSTSLEGNQWYLNGNQINNAIENSYIPDINGDYYVIAKQGECESLPSNTISFIKTSINEINKSNNCLIYPNPTTGIFYIDFKAFDGNKDVSIYDVTGKLLKRIQTVNNLLFINLTNEAKGLYLIKINTGQRVINSKIELK